MICGNTVIKIQISATGKNEIGEAEKTWDTVQSIRGWLDLSSGDSKYTTYNAKMQESTHIFVSDYVQLNRKIKAENSRVIDEDGLTYDIMLVDDPMKLHKQLEIYLKYTGGQTNGECNI
jgi:head-tail adaptor